MGAKKKKVSVDFWKRFINEYLEKKEDSPLSSKMKEIFNFASEEEKKLVDAEKLKREEALSNAEEFHNLVKEAITELYNKKIREYLKTLKVKITNADPDMTGKENTMQKYAAEVSGNPNIYENTLLKSFLNDLRDKEEKVLTKLETSYKEKKDEIEINYYRKAKEIREDIKQLVIKRIEDAKPHLVEFESGTQLSLPFSLLLRL